jgi:hypothetical protein
MAPKDATKMGEFVQRNAAARGGARQSGPDFTDLKAPVPPSPNTAAQRRKSDNGPPNGAAARSASQARVAHPNGQAAATGPFYETDASEADKTSTARTGRRVTGDQRQGDQAEDSGGDEYEEDGDDEFPPFDSNGPKDPKVHRKNSAPQISGQLNPKQMAITQRMEADRRLDGSAWPRVKGDSYPSTTSGAPSAHKAPVKSQNVPQAFNQPGNVANLPQADARSSQNRVPLVQAPQASQPSHVKQEPSSQRLPTNIQNGLLHKPVDAHDIPGQDFHYSKPPAPKPVTAHPVRPAAIPPAASQPARKENIHPRGDTNRTRSNSPVKPQRPTRPQTPPRVPHIAEHIEQSVGEPKDDDHVESRFQHVEAQPEYDGQALDYEPEELYAQDFPALKADVFDVDPNGTSFSLPDDMPTHTLSDKMKSAARLSPTKQADFFATLNIDDWEDAGDWFLDQFKGVVARFKATRQEKRKAAREFEDEVESRHHAVSKKRKLTEDALGDMKTSGAQVLQGTPKKAKKTK